MAQIFKQCCHSFQISYKYREYFLEYMIEAITDKTPEVRQAAAYGVGVIGQFGGETYADVCAGENVNLMTLDVILLLNGKPGVSNKQVNLPVLWNSKILFTHF